MRKKLETEYLAESLRGRLTYFVTTYHAMHDGDEGRVAVRLDGCEILKSNYFDRWDARCEAERSMKAAGETEDLWDRSWEAALESGAFYQMDFYRAFYEFDRQSIAESLSSGNPLVRMLALLDRRTGKRTLERIRERMTAEPDWLQMIYYLRLEAEGMAV